jgi:hypothetical protein
MVMQNVVKYLMLFGILSNGGSPRIAGPRRLSKRGTKQFTNFKGEL